MGCAPLPTLAAVRRSHGNRSGGHLVEQASGRNLPVGLDWAVDCIFRIVRIAEQVGNFMVDQRGQVGDIRAQAAGTQHAGDSGENEGVVATVDVADIDVPANPLKTPYRANAEESPPT